MSNSVAKIHPLREREARRFSLYAIDGGRKYLNQIERQRFLAATAALSDHEALFARTLFWSGARISEVLALRPSSIQLECGVVAFSTLKRRRLVFREVPMPPDHVDALDRHFALTSAQSDPELAQLCLWPWHRATAWRLVKKVMARARVVGRPACPRGLRHGFGVGTLQSGVPLNLTQRWMGHARMSTTAIYADVVGPEEQAMAARFWRRADHD
jgi:integrase